MNLFGSDQWKSFLQIKPHLVTKITLRARTGAIVFMNSIIEDMLKKTEVLLHGCKLRKR